MTLHQIFEQVKTEHARSLAKHGKWVGLRATDQGRAIQSEFEEWLDAFYRGDVSGDHGEVAELVQLMNVAARRIMYLTGEEQ